jgi:glycosyltransferase involved in cell wall biosynthesis
MSNKIAILIPCLDEKATIVKVINDFKQACPQAIIYVYDNNSTDGSGELAQNAGAVVRRETRLGKGYVIHSMFRQIDADCYILVDGDDTYPAEIVNDLIEPILNGNADMVIGDRLSGTYFTENKRAFHNFGNRLVRLLINLIFRSDVKDIMSGYRAFSKTYVKNYPVLATGFEIETEMTIHALDKGFLIRQIPIQYRDRPANSHSKINTFRDGFRVLNTIFRLFENYRPLLFYGILSIIGIVISTVFFIPILIEYLQTGLVPRFPTLIICGVIATLSLVSLVCGIILDAVKRNNRFFYEMLLNQWKDDHLG